MFTVRFLFTEYRFNRFDDERNWEHLAGTVRPRAIVGYALGNAMNMASAETFLTFSTSRTAKPANSSCDVIGYDVRTTFVAATIRSRLSELRPL
jgi:hypothetical protein